jgi:TorA maturation chaperone TorD
MSFNAVYSLIALVRAAQQHPLWIAVYNLFRATIENLEHQIAKLLVQKKAVEL